MLRAMSEGGPEKGEQSDRGDKLRLMNNQEACSCALTENPALADWFFYKCNNH